MAICDYALCHKCQGKAFYDANISDPGYCATWDPSEEADPIGIAVLCAECAKSYEVMIVPIGQSDENERLRIALADAIRRPMGVVPASAEGLVGTADLDAAEQRRPRGNVIASAPTSPPPPKPKR